MTALYAHLRKTFPALPAHAQLSLYFDIHIDGETYPLRKILEHLLERTEHTKTLLRSLLEPDTGNIMGMYEHAHATTEYLEEAYLLYKELCHLERSIHVAQLSTRAADHVSTIAHVADLWPRLQYSVKLILTHIRDNWALDHSDTHRGPEYMG